MELMYSTRRGCWINMHILHTYDMLEKMQESI